MAWTTYWTTADELGREGNRDMVPTAGPLQQTFVRICVDSINPRQNFTVKVLFDWSYNNDAKYNAVNNGRNWGDGCDRDIYKPVN